MGLEPGAASEAQTDPLSYGGTLISIFYNYIFISQGSGSVIVRFLYWTSEVQIQSVAFLGTVENAHSYILHDFGS